MIRSLTPAPVRRIYDDPPAPRNNGNGMALVHQLAERQDKIEAKLDRVLDKLERPEAPAPSPTPTNHVERPTPRVNIEKILAHFD